MIGREIPLTDTQCEAYLQSLLTDYEHDYGSKLKPSDITCSDCSERKACPFAYDMYNTRGDCLASR